MLGWPARGMRALALLSLAVGLAGCQSQPTLDDARDLLARGEPVRALEAARAAAARASREELPALRRVAFDASLAAGWSGEAAREYLALRELLGRDDDQLLVALATGTLECALRDFDASRRLRCARLLSAVGATAQGSRLLLQALRDDQPEVRAAAAHAAASWPEPEHGLRQLEQILQEDQDPVVRRTALRSLAQSVAGRTEGDGQLDFTFHLALASQGLSDADEGVRLAALDVLEALRVHGAPRLRAPLQRVLEQALERSLATGQDLVIRRAASCLVQLDPDAALTTWRASELQPERGPLAAFAVALAAHGRPSPEAEAAVRALLTGAYGSRLAAVQGLRGPGAAAFVGELSRLAVSDPAAPVRAAAVDALAAGGPRAAVVRALEEALAHPHPATRHRALDALDRLGSLTTADQRQRLAAGDPALAPAASRWLVRHGGEPGLRAVRAALEREETRLPALAALVGQVDPRLREGFLALLGHRDPQVRAQAALALMSCGHPTDRLRLVRALERPDAAADLGAAAALLAIQERILRTAPGHAQASE